ncbi:Nam8p [Cyberlindnera jadinii NRRL Y-1542]|uniref:RNA-binding domain-containing protein n=1 Tax=Cyberlindnera jadinii (strain ATCC 18201 / CBS 1600 / BCRC 20928 / JCM 3617 / NBRC 0987 / NRRL Y-1542) TaxID=983966 RepID=A0A1E4S6H9_CYBJN|nr:RNA-binding domain-containing protein [Cyberlindnera jadinii NRRL Y-1542]ODV75073.1 RNA-binding domain-containing protein [Cyberlindnera jadinii NRRL Y-1542]
MSYNGYSQQPQQQNYHPYRPQQQSTLRNSSTQLWMGELDPFWDESFIKAIWQSFGFVDVNVKIIKDFKTGTQAYNAGYCFVEFPNLNQASDALSKNGSRIANTNRLLKLNWASGGSTGRNNNANVNSGANGNGNASNENSIFVGDLAPDVTESILFEFFASKYPSVTGTKIMVDMQSGLSKGYGFVRFSGDTDQQRALVEMQGAVVNGRPIRVSTAVPKNRQQGQGQDSQYQPPLNQFTDPNNTTVFIGGLSSVVTEEDLRLYFQPFGDITYVKIPIGKGCGFVQYTTRTSAELAISKMQGYPIGNSRVRLSWGRSSANPKGQHMQYKPQQELPILYGFDQEPQQFSQIPQQGSIPDRSEGMEQSRLNQLYLAARDGRLDTIDSLSNGFVF